MIEKIDQQIASETTCFFFKLEPSVWLAIWSIPSMELQAVNLVSIEKTLKKGKVFVLYE